MLLLKKPSEEIVRQFIASQQELPFSYPGVGASQDNPQHQPRAGFTVDHNRIKLGAGQETYERARAALQSWKQFDLGWVTVRPSKRPLEVGRTVAVQARVFGLWWLNAARIVYVIDESEGRTSGSGSRMEPYRIMLSAAKRGLRSSGARMKTIQFGMTSTLFPVPNIRW